MNVHTTVAAADVRRPPREHYDGPSSLEFLAIGIMFTLCLVFFALSQRARSQNS